jgi:DNA-binding NarL/FixJ family response regulator
MSGQNGMPFPGSNGFSTASVVVGGCTRLYCDGIALLLTAAGGVEVVGKGTTRTEILDCVDEVAPDVVLLDPAVAGGMELVRELALDRDVRVVAHGCFDSDIEMLACAEAGVCGFLTREASVDDLVAAIRGANEGELLCSPKMAAALLRRVTALASGRLHDATDSELTTRELQVARLIDQGLSNKQIALQLEIELSTVKHHVHHILEKLEVARRGEAVARLRQRGVLQR